MSTQVRRFTFPGFSLVRQGDTSTHEVEVGKVTVGDEVLIVHMIRRSGLSLPGGGDFLVAKVFDQSGKMLWEFPKGSFNGFGLLAKAGEETVIALLTRHTKTSRVVEEVVPLSAIRAPQIELCRKMELKRRAAEFLGCDVVFSDTERLVSRRDQERLRLKRKAEEEERRRLKAEANQARVRAREELIARVTGRAALVAFTPDGRRRSGVPVLEDEWRSLPNGTFVVLVESYDEDAKEAGVLWEAFRVIKREGGAPKKGSPSPVAWKMPERTAALAPKPLGSVAIETKEGFFEVSVFATMEEIRLAREMGLNNGALVTAEDQKAADGRITVFSVHAEGTETLGLFVPVA